MPTARRPKAARVASSVAAAQRGMKRQAQAAQAAGVDIDSEVSIFESELADMLRDVQDNPDAADAATYNALLKMALNLLPVAERTYRAVKSDRAMLPVDKLVVQIRELINELKKQRELQDQHVKIMDLAQSSFKAALEAFVDAMYLAKSSIKGDLTRQDFAKVAPHLDALTQNYAATVRELTTMLQNDIQAYFTPIPEAPKRRKP